MKHADYVYTRGMDEEESERRLREHSYGVLALARDDDAYAVPLNYHYDRERLLLRVSEESRSTKVAYIQSTETATFVVHGVEDNERSWSVIIRGRIDRLPDEEQEELTDALVNEWFPPFRLFDEDVLEVEMAIYELNPDETIGRKTPER
jgi:uncharacterized protein